MNEPSEPLSTTDYLAKFSDPEKRKKALECALDIRKFEIELYWKRATYFWTFIGVTLAGYGALQASSAEEKSRLSILLSCLGLVFSFGWFCVNKGSKKWQENWEKNVNLLEDEVLGPLFKTVWDKKPPEESADCMKQFRRFAIGPGRFSGSKINQIISLAITALWVILWFGAAIPTFSPDEWPDCVAVIATIGSILTCRALWKDGKASEFKSYWHPDDVDK